VAGIDDTMSEFSVMSDASDMLPLENILDLKIDEIQFNTQQVNQMLGIDRNVENQVQTFVTLEFFNHSIKHTDLTMGYNPKIASVFSFKNPVDDFYVRYLQQSHILVEVFIVKGSGNNKETVKMGVAKLPLSPLLNDKTGLQVQKIEGADDSNAFFGTIKFRSKMRRSLKHAKEKLERA
jgi:hypothetical protein